MISGTVQGLQIAASLAILIWFKDRILHERRFGASLVLLCVGYVLPAFVLLLGATSSETTLQLAGVSGVFLGASLFYLFFSLVEFPWDIVNRPEKKSETTSKAAPKKKPARKKKTTG